MRDPIPVTIVVQLLLSIAIWFGSRGEHLLEEDGVEVFRISPPIAWMLAIASFCIAIILAVAMVALYLTPPDVPIHVMLGELLFFFFGIYGIYCISMRIRVDGNSFRVNSLFRKQITHFRDIGSVSDKVTGRYRTLDVSDSRGKRVLYVTSTFLPDYDELVNLLQEGVREHRAGGIDVDHSKAS
jgi:hypothetical protein